MDAIRRTSTLRRVATTASLATLLLAPGQADAARKKAKPKSPVITSVSPMTATVGDTLTIRGRNFRKGNGRNTVGFKRSGEAIVFVKAGLSTTRVMAVRLSAKLEKVLQDGQPARFNLRVLTKVFGKQYTSKKLSPVIAPRPPQAPGAEGTPTPTGTPGPAEPAAPCSAGTSETADLDKDLLSDGLEQRIGTNGCDADSDDDGVTDGYEYRSAIDLNDDEYQEPNASLPYPGAMPYPNPLFADADKDYDGDGLTMRTEYDLWAKYTPEAQRTVADQAGKATPLSYSDGLQYSVSRRDQGRVVPTLTGDTYDKYQDFLQWLVDNGYRNADPDPADKSVDPAPLITLHDNGGWTGFTDGWRQYDIFDVDRDGVVSDEEEVVIDVPRANDRYPGYLSDDERDEDADGLSNLDEIRGAMTPSFWTACYSAEPVYAIPYAGTDPANADSDGDGVRDGADDQDHDDVPNLMELSRFKASHLNDTDDGIKGAITGGDRACKPDVDLKADEDRHPGAFGRVNPFNPCMPDNRSRTCELRPQIGAEEGPNWWALN